MLIYCLKNHIWAILDHISLLLDIFYNTSFDMASPPHPHPHPLVAFFLSNNIKRLLNLR